eukprot:scaffold307_cov390-Prasinococcus_capsulatus_cf.AAC.15
MSVLHTESNAMCVCCGVQFTLRAKDTATEMPSAYQAPLAIGGDHSKVQLSWDIDPLERRSKLRKAKFSLDQLKEDDFQAYLASSSDEGDEQELDGQEETGTSKEERRRQQAQRYRGLLLGKSGGKADDGEDEGESEEDDGIVREDDEDDDLVSAAKQLEKTRRKPTKGGDMQISFRTGLESAGHDILEKFKQKKLQGEETVWEARQRKRAERKKMSRQQGEDGPELKEKVTGAAGSAGSDDDPFNDPFFQDSLDIGVAEAEDERRALGKDQGPSSGSGARSDDGVKTGIRPSLLAKSAEALEDEEDEERRQLQANRRGGPKSKLTRKQKMEEKKKKKRDAALLEADEDDGTGNAHAAFDPLSDERFRTKLLGSPDFALDPTAPQFRSSESAPKLAKAVAQERRGLKAKGNHDIMRGSDSKRSEKSPGEREKATGATELAAMVKSLKRKVGENAAKKKKYRQ